MCSLNIQVAHRNGKLMSHARSNSLALLRNPWLAPFNDLEAWDRLSTAMNPLWSLTEARARVVRVIDEAPGVRSLWLKPNGRFGGFRAGQNVLLELEIDGARHIRCFSFSEAPRADGLLRLTIKRQTHGLVTSAAHRLQPGQIVRLGAVGGNFGPRQQSSKLLLLSAGSGITPMLSWLHQLARQRSDREVVLLHSHRGPAGLILGQELQQLAAHWPQLRVHLHDSNAVGRLDGTELPRLVPDWGERETLLCGPDAFMRTMESAYAQAGQQHLLVSESFGRRPAPIDPGAPAHAVTTTETIQVFTARSGQSLLEAAEASGLQPRYGCRRGICRSCQCRKHSGTVKNLLTGQISGSGEELIQLCISTPQSAVELAL
jgi:stearoyl-CoA 9-desaturase NADPH oxidoreductase